MEKIKKPEMPKMPAMPKKPEMPRMPTMPKKPEMPRLTKQTEMLTTAKCVVHFRPNKNWKGEFGFDWVRIGDSKLKVDINYNGILGKYGSIYASRKGAVFTASNSEYNKCLAEFDSFNSVRGQYYVPKVALAKGQEAILDVAIDVEEKPDKLHYAYDTGLIELTILKKINTAKGKNHIENCVKIKCLKSFDTEQSIRIIATKDELMEKVGEIKLQKNNRIIQTKVLIIPVNYNGKLGTTNAIEQDFLKKAFGHAFIDVLIENYDPNFIVGSWLSDLFFTTTNKDGDKVMDRSSILSIHRYLDENFMETKGNEKYSSYYRVYCLPKSLDLNGVAEDVGKGTKVVIVFENRNKKYNSYGYSTMAHELMHAVGLYHSFDNNAPHTFKYKQTNNIMDYSYERFSTNSWQWKILREKIT